MIPASLERVNEAYWIDMFLPQLVELALAHDLDTHNDIDYKLVLLMHANTAKCN